MKRFTGPPKIVGVQVGEVRVREIGRSPSTMAKFAMMTNDGQSAGLFILHAFSDRTQKLLAALIDSMELDAANHLSDHEEGNPLSDRGSWNDEEDEDDGLSFP